jgi:GTPase SAR1 family protein
MPIKIISVDERIAEERGAKVLVAGPTGVGKTSLARTLEEGSVLFIDIEAGDLSILDLPVDTVRVDDWETARDIACRVGGPNPSYSPLACYSEAHYRAVGGEFPNLSKYKTLFIDSLTALSRLSFRWSEQQPECISEKTGRKDTRSAYGLHAREMLALLMQLQRARGKHVVFVGILERVTDDYGRQEWALQMEGARTWRELPGIVDQIITMNIIDFGDGQPAQRALVCHNPNAWGFPAKDRSGRLAQIEEPHLGRLLAKLTSKQG